MNVPGENAVAEACARFGNTAETVSAGGTNWPLVLPVTCNVQRITPVEQLLPVIVSDPTSISRALVVEKLKRGFSGSAAITLALDTLGEVTESEAPNEKDVTLAV